MCFNTNNNINILALGKKGKYWQTEYWIAEKSLATRISMSFVWELKTNSTKLIYILQYNLKLYFKSVFFGRISAILLWL